MLDKTIIKIPAQKNALVDNTSNRDRKKRVAAYARVSTSSDEQFTSFQAQKEYYQNYILLHEGWEFVEVYSDEGISGLGVKNRKGFLQMIDDACAGKIDLIVTKSVSRFARNTVDALQTIRKLKQHKVEVFFEKENIYTFDGKGELLLTIMGSLAQEESRSLSMNTTWGKRRCYEKGQFSLPYSRFIGYDKGANGPVINEEEADIIRLIYQLFLEGDTINGIIKDLDSRGIQRPGKNPTWYSSGIKSILTNEKYKGSAILQKKFIVDYLTKEEKINEGEIPQYYIEHSHEPIIEPKLWDFVQEEYKRRLNHTMHPMYGSSVLTSKLICADCGSLFGKRSFQRKNGKKIAWVCNKKYLNHCKTPLIIDSEVQTAFLSVYNSIIENYNRTIEECNLIISGIADVDLLSDRIKNLIAESEKIVDQIEGLILQNRLKKKPYEEFQAEYNKLCARGEKIDNEIQKLKAEKEDASRRKNLLLFYIETLQNHNSIQTEWDPMLFSLTVRQVTVNRDRTLTFQMWSSAEYIVPIEN